MATPRLGAPELTPAQAVPEGTVNETFYWLDAGSGGGFKFLDRDLTAPPGSPSQGDTYLVDTGGTGAWSGHDGEIAIYIGTSWEFTAPDEGHIARVVDENIWIGYDGSTWATIAFTIANPTEFIALAVSDETTALTTGTAKITFRMPYAFTLSAVRASVTTAPTGSTLVVDINEGGSTILSTKLSIDASEKTSTTAASAAVISDTALADDAEMTIDIDQIGSTIAGAGLKVVLIGVRA
jgi:hypothetical protein